MFGCGIDNARRWIHNTRSFSVSRARPSIAIASRRARSWIPDGQSGSGRAQSGDILRLSITRAMRVTIHDVAEDAGVSAMTVSRVINESPRVSAETRRRVQASVAKLGLRPEPPGARPHPAEDRVVRRDRPGRGQPLLHADRPRGRARRLARRLSRHPLRHSGRPRARAGLSRGHGLVPGRGRADRSGRGRLEAPPPRPHSQRRAVRPDRPVDCRLRRRSRPGRLDRRSPPARRAPDRARAPAHRDGHGGRSRSRPHATVSRDTGRRSPRAASPFDEALVVKLERDRPRASPASRRFSSSISPTRRRRSSR